MSVKQVCTFFGWPLLLLPTVVLWAGIGMNQIAVHANKGMMPVYMAGCPTFMTAKADDAGHPDYVHNCMTPETRLKVLGDIIVSSDGVYSLGDEVQEFSSVVRFAADLIWAATAVFCLWFKRPFYLE